MINLRGELDSDSDSGWYRAHMKWYSAGAAAFEWENQRMSEHRAGKRFLDYACGDGAVSVRAAKMGADVTGNDISPVSIEIARRKALEEQVPVNFAVMDAENTDFDRETFDTVLCSGVLHHMNLEVAFQRSLGF